MPKKNEEAQPVAETETKPASAEELPARYFIAEDSAGRTVYRGLSRKEAIAALMKAQTPGTVAQIKIVARIAPVERLAIVR